MPGLVVGEVNGCANPRVFFVHRTTGVLSDPFELKYSVINLTGATPSTTIAETTVNLAACPVGSKVGLGRFAPPIDTTSYTVGTYEVRWKYKSVSTSDYHTARQRFEVLDATKFLEGDEYVGYVTTKQLQNWGFAQTVAELQDLINIASRRVERLTGRFFEPRFLDMIVSSRGNRMQTFDQPIIAIESADIQATSLAGTIEVIPIDPSVIQVFNRHLGGLLSPDDRDDPKIQFVDAWATADTATLPPVLTFPRGVLNIHVPGVYGYTDPDGSPMGETPVELSRAVAMLVAQAAISPVSSGSGSGGGLIKSARTRDQAVTYFGPTEGGGSNLTGNREIDDILISYARPAQLGAV